MTDKYKQKGFTLIELLVYISTAAIVFMIIMSVVYMMMQSKSKSKAIAEVEQQGSFAMDIISQTIRNAQGIESPAPGTSSSSLQLDISEAGDDPTTIDLNSNAISITEGLGSAIPLTSSSVIASDIYFENLSRDNTPGIIRISFTLTSTESGRGSRYYSKNFYTSASLR